MKKYIPNPYLKTLSILFNVPTSAYIFAVFLSRVTGDYNNLTPRPVLFVSCLIVATIFGILNIIYYRRDRMLVSDEFVMFNIDAGNAFWRKSKLEKILREEISHIVQYKRPIGSYFSWVTQNIIFWRKFAIVTKVGREIEVPSNFLSTGKILADYFGVKLEKSTVSGNV